MEMSTLYHKVIVDFVGNMSIKNCVVLILNERHLLETPIRLPTSKVLLIVAFSQKGILNNSVPKALSNLVVLGIVTLQPNHCIMLWLP